MVPEVEIVACVLRILQAFLDINTILLAKSWDRNKK